MSYRFSDWLVTPKHKMSDFKFPLDLEQKIVVFFEQTDGWQLDVARRIIEGVKDKDGKNIDFSESAYAVLNIVFSFFETNAKYQDGYVGIGKAKFHFKEGVKSVFPKIRDHPEEFPDMLYSYCRCGLYHGGFPDTRIFLRTDIPTSLGFKSRQLQINPQRLVLDLRDYLKSYVEKLRDAHNTEARRNFETRFDYLNKLI